MSSPLTVYPGGAVVLPPCLFPPVAYYAAMAAHSRAVVDTARRYDKRCKDVHRYTVADVRGPLRLTVPVSPLPAAHGGTWADVAVSRHGSWWNVHRTALESAYGRTPFFEFVIDRFTSVLADPAATGEPSALELCRRADAAVRAFLGIETAVEWRPAADTDNFRADLRHDSFASPDATPYFQVRESSLGFIPSLSILDLIFNLGDEAPLYLRSLNNRASAVVL